MNKVEAEVVPKKHVYETDQNLAALTQRRVHGPLPDSEVVRVEMPIKAATDFAQQEGCAYDMVRAAIGAALESNK